MDLGIEPALANQYGTLITHQSYMKPDDIKIDVQCHFTAEKI